MVELFVEAFLGCSFHGIWDGEMWDHGHVLDDSILVHRPCFFLWDSNPGMGELEWSILGYFFECSLWESMDGNSPVR